MSTTTQNQNLIPIGYPELFEILKEKIRSSQIKAALAVNCELLSLYWEIGTKILLKQKNEGWGSKIVETLSKDLRSAFPDMKGFSITNVKYMVQFAKEYPDLTISQQPVGQIPWGHNILLFQKLSSLEERLWYAKKTIENGWSRNTLEMWIESDLYSRQGKAITNFAATLPHPDSDLAQAELKDPYCFDFLRMRGKADEAEIENGLIEHIQKVLVELGTGFVLLDDNIASKWKGKNF
jgi:predicted nuclease of restriction endonuclease-like (RecB) superfamily